MGDAEDAGALARLGGAGLGRAAAAALALGQVHHRTPPARLDRAREGSAHDQLGVVRVGADRRYVEGVHGLRA
jgi:hypothetical protein